MPTLVQSASVASSAAGPSSITPTLPVASKPGNHLLIAVVLTGSGLSLTTPANWTSLGTPPGVASIIGRLLIFPNNPGGITTVPITITDTGGGAAASIFEFSGMGPNFSQESEGDTANAGVTSFGGVGVPPVPLDNNELGFYFVGFAATTLTPTNSVDWVGPLATAVSTSGTPNAQIACFYSLGPAQGALSTIGGSFGASVGLVVMQIRWFNSGHALVAEINDYGARGIYVGQFNQGMIGG